MLPPLPGLLLGLGNVMSRVLRDDCWLFNIFEIISVLSYVNKEYVQVLTIMLTFLMTYVLTVPKK